MQNGHGNGVTNGTKASKFEGVKTIDELGSYERLIELEYLGRVPNTTFMDDPRFCYTLYIPKNYFELSSIRLLVLVHGSGRDHSTLHDLFRSYAIENNIALFTPLFPRGVTDQNDPDNYKTIQCDGIRYDELLLSMLEQVKWRYPKVSTDKFFIHGFSGGGQFVHRFLYLHPERLLAAVIGAPGHITMPDTNVDFPLGTRDLEQRFGIPFDMEALKKVHLGLLVGAADTDKAHVLVRKDRVLPVVNGKKLVLNRIEDLHRLESGLLDAGHPSVTFIAVPEVGHQWKKVVGTSGDYLKQYLAVA